MFKYQSCQFEFEEEELKLICPQTCLTSYSLDLFHKVITDSNTVNIDEEIGNFIGVGILNC